MGLDLRGIEIDFAQVARCITQRFVVEVRRIRMTAFAARGDRSRADPLWTKLHDRDKAIAAGAVPALRPRLLRRREGRKRAPRAVGEANRDAGKSIAERRVDRWRNTLKAIDLAPRDAPAAEISL